MKIFFNKGIWLIALVIFMVVAFSSCKKNNAAKTNEAQNPMAQAFIKAQTTDKPKTKTVSF